MFLNRTSEVLPPVNQSPDPELDTICGDGPCSVEVYAIDSAGNRFLAVYNHAEAQWYNTGDKADIYHITNWGALPDYPWDHAVSKQREAAKALMAVGS